MTTAERNRLIKKVLSKAFGKVRVRGHRGTAYGWVTIDIDYRPRHREELAELTDKVWELFDKAGIKIGSYGTPGDMGCDYGWGRNMHLNFGMCRDEFAPGEKVTWEGKTGKISNVRYNNPNWYGVRWDDDPEKEIDFYKGDLKSMEVTG